jgi:hypothetical protein
MMGVSKDEESQGANDAEEITAHEDTDVTAITCLLNEKDVPVGDNQEEQSDDDIQSEYVPERECTDTISRVHRKGVPKCQDVQDCSSFSLWDSIAPMTQNGESGANDKCHQASTRKCSWDELFISKEEEVDDERLEDLLHLFDDDKDGPDDDGETDAKPCQDDENTSAPLLSQEAQTIAEQIISNAGPKSDMLDRSCPSWKENVSFALRQDDSATVQEALENVQMSRRRMMKVRERILEAWERQDAALEVFETALKASWKRLNSKLPPSQNQEDVGEFLSQSSHEKGS